MNCIRLIIGLLALMPFTAMAQGNDVGLWTSAGIEKKLTKKWTIGAEAEYRMRDNISTTDRASIGVTTSYKLAKWLKTSVGYEYLHTRKAGGYNTSGNYYYSTYWYPRHRVQLSLTGSWKLSKTLKLSVRERWQYTYRASFDQNRLNTNKESLRYGQISQKNFGGKGTNVLRTRATLSYNIPKCKFEPFASVEMYNSCGGDNNCFGSIEKMRYAAGTEYKINKRNSVELYYMYQDYQNREDDDQEGAHIIGLGYNYSF